MKLLLAALILLVLAAPAKAAEHPMIDRMADMGQEFWAARDVHPCSPIKFEIQDDLDKLTPVDAEGFKIGTVADATYRESCVVQLSRDLVVSARRDRPRRLRRGWRRGGNGLPAKLELCATIFHAEGHAKGSSTQRRG